MGDGEAVEGCVMAGGGMLRERGKGRREESGGWRGFERVRDGKNRRGWGMERLWKGRGRGRRRVDGKAVEG